MAETMKYSVEDLRLKRSLLLQLLNVAWNLPWMWQIFFNILFLKTLLLPVESNHKTASPFWSIYWKAGQLTGAATEENQDGGLIFLSALSMVPSTQVVTAQSKWS